MIVSKLENIINNIRNEQIIEYNNRPLIRLIYGRLFNLFFDFLNGKEHNKIYHISNFITNGLIKNLVLNFTYKTDGNKYKDIIENIEKYIKEILIQNEELEYKGVLLYQYENLEKDLVQIYIYLTKNNPNVQNILLCNKETNNEEITSFLYRAILCEYNSCFIVGGIELLELEQQKYILTLLNNLINKKHEKIKSRLIILYKYMNDDIYKDLDLLKYKNKLSTLQKNIENTKVDDSKIEIISSDKSGVGKTTQIILEIIRKNKIYIHFPFKDFFDRESIIEKLLKLTISNDCIIHLDIYDINQTELLNEFLFSLLITKIYGKNEDIFYIPKDIEIKVEIHNEYSDCIKKYPILGLFPSKKMSIKNLYPLIVPDKKDSKIQIVANHFH